MRNVLRFSLTMVLMLLLSIGTAHALGITPGKHKMDFVAGDTATVDVTVVNTEAKTMDVVLYVEGALADYVTLSQQHLHFDADTKEHHVTYTVTLPDTIGEPGVHSANIVAREIGSVTEGGDIIVKALVAVASTLDVAVPYPGKYLQTTFYIPDTTDKQVIHFQGQAMNLGTQDIATAYMEVEIRTTDNEKVTELTTEEQSLPRQKRTEFLATWEPDATQAGSYTATATFHYDGEKKTESKTFTVGGFPLVPLDVAVDDFTLGEVAKFNTLVQNIGATTVQEASVQITLNDQIGAVIADFTSDAATLQSEEIRALISYWDTATVEQGSYEGILTLRADALSQEHRIRTTVTADSITTEFLDITGQVILGRGILEQITIKPGANIALITILIIIANIIGWTLYFKRRKKPPKHRSMRGF